MIQGQRIVNVTAAILGNAYMENRMPTGVKPYPGRIEWRTVAYFESKYLRVELAQSIKVASANVEMVDALDAHSRYQGRAANSMTT